MMKIHLDQLIYHLSVLTGMMVRKGVPPHHHHMGGSINGGTPTAGWFIREKLMKMDDLEGTPISGNLHMRIPG